MFKAKHKQLETRKFVSLIKTETKRVKKKTEKQTNKQSKNRFMLKPFSLYNIYYVNKKLVKNF